MTSSKNRRLRVRVFILVSLFAIMLGSCKNENKYSTHGLTKNNKETRLGVSNYYILLPDNFGTAEVSGKEGFLAYNILPKDSSLRMVGVIQIKRGNPIGNSAFVKDTIPAEIYPSSFLGKDIIWTIKPLEKGYYAFLDRRQDLSAYIYANERHQIDSLISIISTLTKK